MPQGSAAVVMVVIVWVIEKLICDGREEARVLVR
jgi:hypothetical protein